MLRRKTCRAVEVICICLFIILLIFTLLIKTKQVSIYSGIQEVVLDSVNIISIKNYHLIEGYFVESLSANESYDVLNVKDTDIKGLLCYLNSKDIKYHYGEQDLFFTNGIDFIKVLDIPIGHEEYYFTVDTLIIRYEEYLKMNGAIYVKVKDLDKVSSLFIDSGYVVEIISKEEK